MKESMTQEEKERRKFLKKKWAQRLNEPPKLAPLEEVGNSVTHGVGTLLSIAGFVLMLIKSDTGLKVMASCFYGISLTLLMLMSCLYHAYPQGSAVKRLWRRFDYSSIYLLIGGTFAPLYLIYWGNTLGITLFCIQWGLIALGIIIILIFGPGNFRPLHYTQYFVIGWSAIIFFPDWIRHDIPLMTLVLSGGIIYTVGMIPFCLKKKAAHFIWHFFVLAGAIMQWLGIYLYVY